VAEHEHEHCSYFSGIGGHSCEKVATWAVWDPAWDPRVDACVPACDEHVAALSDELDTVHALAGAIICCHSCHRTPAELRTDDHCRGLGVSVAGGRVRWVCAECWRAGRGAA
jgi:hypothetical protein